MKIRFDKIGLPVIKEPKYLVGSRDLNEYELRHLMLMVAKGLVSSPIVVIDIEDNIAHIKEDGSLTRNLIGMDWTVKSTMKLLECRNERIV